MNMAIEINGQPPLQVFLIPTAEPKIILRSIDLGEREDIEEYEQITKPFLVGSAFAITKTALSLAGFNPAFSGSRYKNLKTQLKELGGGIEISKGIRIGNEFHPRCDGTRDVV